jgi:hypothetical protein
MKQKAQDQIITFDVGPNTAPTSINSSGETTGYCADASSGFHSFLCAKDGTITTFDLAGASAGGGAGTFAQSINPAGAITGTFQDGFGASHAFLREP